MDHLYSRTETPDGNDAAGALPEETSGAGSGSAGIMAALPRRRPHRRSALRERAQAPIVPRAVAGRGAAAPAFAAAEPVDDRHLRAVGDAADVQAVSHRRKSRRRTLPPPREPAPGIARLALDGAVETAKFPWRVAAEVARQAADSVASTLRR